MSLRVNCAEVLENLDAWIDGDVEESVAAVFEEHVSDCQDCQVARRFAEEIRVELRGMPEFSPPGRVLAAVAEATRPTLTERISRVLGWVVLRPVPTAVSLVAMVALLLVIVPRGERQTEQFSEMEIRRATAETRLALAYVSDAAQRAERGVRQKVLEERGFRAAVRGISRTLSWAGDMGVAQPTIPASPTNTSKGS